MAAFREIECLQRMDGVRTDGEAPGLNKTAAFFDPRDSSIVTYHEGGYCSSATDARTLIAWLLINQPHLFRTT